MLLSFQFLKYRNVIRKNNFPKVTQLVETECILELRWSGSTSEFSLNYLKGTILLNIFEKNIKTQCEVKNHLFFDSTYNHAI